MKVSELEGAALDLWVARALDLRAIPGEPDGFFYWKEGIYDASGWFAPSTDWAQGGPLIQSERINLRFGAGYVVARHPADTAFEPIADSALVAAMRAFVASKYGDTVPDS